MPPTSPSSTPPPSGATDTLEAERARRSVVLNHVRALGWSAFGVLSVGLGFGLGFADWRGVAPVVAASAVVAVCFAVASKASPALARISPATLAADVAVVGYVQIVSIRPLVPGGPIAASASGVAGFNVAIYLVLMILAGLSLRVAPIVMVTATAIVCEYVVQDAAAVGPGGQASAAILFGIGAFAIAYLARRQRELVARMEDDQRRLETRVAEQATLIAKREVEGLAARTLELSREKQAAEAAAAAKALFLANMSHELRTPLNAVIGMTSLLSDAQLADESREQVQVIRASGEHVLALINDILDFSKIDAGKVELEAIPVSIAELVEPTLDLVSASAHARDVEIAYQIQPGTPTLLVADPGRVRQVLLNLVSNGVKFTARGEVIVSISAVREGEEGRWRFRFRVRDTGVGIPEEARERLFQAFSQVDASTTRTHGGTGLGLVISARLAARMGGTISFESELGKGSTFDFTMAATVPEGGEVDESLAAERFARASGAVLVIHRSEAIRTLLARQLEGWGLSVRTGLSPTRAGWGDERTPAIVLDAACLPGADLARVDEALGDGHPPVVLIHASELRPSRRRHPWAIAKPVKLSALRETLSRALAGDSPHITQRIRPLASSIPDLGPRLRILVAEDNPVNQKVAGAILRRLGHEPNFVANGAEAVAAVARQTYDVVLMDVQMPEMDGLEATREILRRTPPKTRPWIVGVTASALAEDREACRDAGMDDYVSKPVTVASLGAALAKCTPSTAASRPASGPAIA